MDLINNKKLRIGDILKIAISLFKTNWKIIFFINLIIFLPINIVTSVITAKMPNDYLEILRDSVLTQTIPASLSLYSGVMLLVLLFFAPLARIAMFFIANETANKAEFNLNAILEKTFSKWKYLFIASLAWILVIYISALLFIIPAIYFSVCYIFYVQVLASSADKNGFKVLAYSRALVKRKWFQTSFTIIFFIALKYLVEFLLLYVFALLPVSRILGVVYSTTASFLECFIHLCYAVWFLNIDAFYKKESAK